MTFIKLPDLGNVLPGNDKFILIKYTTFVLLDKYWRMKSLPKNLNILPEELCGTKLYTKSRLNRVGFLQSEVF